MIIDVVEEKIYSTEDKIPKEGEIVLVLINTELQNAWDKWYLREFAKEPDDFYWQPAEFAGVSFGYAEWFHVNMSSYGSRIRKYITHWKYISPPPDVLKGLEFS